MAKDQRCRTLQNISFWPGAFLKLIESFRRFCNHENENFLKGRIFSTKMAESSSELLNFYAKESLAGGVFNITPTLNWCNKDFCSSPKVDKISCSDCPWQVWRRGRSLPKFPAPLLDSLPKWSTYKCSSLPTNVRLARINWHGRTL